jgi:hypothetical protein
MDIQRLDPTTSPWSDPADNEANIPHQPEHRSGERALSIKDFIQSGL